MKKLLAVVGPTATGKTDLAISLAKKFNGEIVSADSRQIYKGMDIGTGKELSQKSKVKSQKFEKHKGYWVVEGIPIYLYDVINPDESFSVAEYQQLAYEKIAKIHEKEKLPILVGGTGLYTRSVLQGLKIPQVAPDNNLRKKLEKKPLGILLKELEEVDYKAYQKIDKSNPRRVIRALEVYLKTGRTISELAAKFKPNFESLVVGLSAPREVLYEKADKRVELWFKTGFVDEVRELLKKYSSDLPSINSLGYRQAVSYLQNKISLPEAIQRTKFDHHGYIRRQLTWFRKERVEWFDVGRPGFEKEIYRKVREWIKD